MKIIASMIESAQWQAWLSQQNSPYPIVTNSKKPCTNEVTIVAAPCSLAEIDSDLLDYDELVIHIWGLQATLANALRNGAEEAQIDSVVAKWVEMSEQLLAWLPKHQHKVNVLSHAHATYFTQDWCEWLNNLGIEWPQTDINTTCARTSQDEYDLFAAYYVKIHPQLERLDQLLLSVALPMGEDYPQLPLSIAELTRQSQHAIRRQRYTDKQLAERETEISQLRQAEKQTQTVNVQHEQADLNATVILLKEKLAKIEQRAHQQEQQWTDTFTEQEKAYQQVNSELQRVQALLESAYQQEQQLQQQLVNQDRELNQLTTAKKNLEQALLDLKEQLSELQSQHQKQLENMREQLDSTANEFKLEKQRWQQTLTQQQQENDLINRELQRVQLRIEAAYQQEQQQQQKRMIKHAELQSALAAKLQAEQQLVAIKTQSNQQQEDLNQKITELENAHNEADQQQHSLKQAVEELTAKTSRLTDENELLIKELHRVQERLETAYYQEQQLQQQVKAHSIKIASLTKRQRVSKLELAKALAEKQALVKQVNEYHASPLWKVTVPVRKLRQNSKRKRSQLLAEQALLIELTELFDKEWYLKQNPDVAAQPELDPIIHYLRFGAEEGRNPSPEFNTEWYLKNYPDVAASGMNPLLHFIQNGQLEGRQTSAPLLEYQP
ncbi:hypothetical protein [Vibrio metschnikovii]|uniref:Uncharacterized protein n=1 Tax=Vibrio metschnikovii TaxID=28172 RepID=A0A9X0RBS2_VIBME|nr:hypothetical protein [Vibrio metschnikovii]MBC5851935.1 hypothetical protein [Vibrio metschnikovii]